MIVLFLILTISTGTFLIVTCKKHRKSATSRKHQVEEDTENNNGVEIFRDKAFLKQQKGKTAKGIAQPVEKVGEQHESNNNTNTDNQKNQQHQPKKENEIHEMPVISSYSDDQRYEKDDTKLPQPLQQLQQKYQEDINTKRSADTTVKEQQNDGDEGSNKLRLQENRKREPMDKNDEEDKGGKDSAKKKKRGYDDKDEDIKKDKDDEEQEQNDSKKSDMEKSRITCFNDDGQAIDWLLIRKLPQKSCYQFDSKMAANSVKRMKFSNDITAIDTALHRTVAQLYETKGDKDVLRIVFSDQQPGNEEKEEEMKKMAEKEKEQPDEDDKKKSKKKREHCSGWGHMKGMLLFRDDQGILVTHSVPRYPKVDKNVFDNTKNGQHILCFNIDKKALAIIIQHLFAAHPDIYKDDMHVPEAYLEMDKMEEVSRRVYSNNFTECMSAKIETPGGLKFDLHTRNHTVKGNERCTCKAFWDEMAEEYEDSIEVQTWINSRLKCQNTNHKVKDIVKITDGQTTWGTTKDHSKYGLCQNKKIIIFSDLNHTELQDDRGGSFYCLRNEEIYDAFVATFKHILQENPI